MTSNKKWERKMDPVIYLEKETLISGQKTITFSEGESPLTVEIFCFTDNPPPAGYKPCAECGSFTISSGQSFDVTANSQLFGASEGFVEISVTDATGSRVVKRVSVLTDSDAHGQSGTMAM